MRIQINMVQEIIQQQRILKTEQAIIQGRIIIRADAITIRRPIRAQRHVHTMRVQIVQRTAAIREVAQRTQVQL